MIVRYEIDYWDDVGQEPKTDYGIAGADDSDTIGEVVDKIYDHYGTENVVSIKVCEYESILTDDNLREMLE